MSVYYLIGFLLIVFLYSVSFICDYKKHKKRQNFKLLLSRFKERRDSIRYANSYNQYYERLRCILRDTAEVMKNQNNTRSNNNEK